MAIRIGEGVTLLLLDADLIPVKPSLRGIDPLLSGARTPQVSWRKDGKLPLEKRVND